MTRSVLAMGVERVVPPGPRWPPQVRALTTTSAGDLPEMSPGEVQWLNQVHGSRCIEARRDTLGNRPRADAAWTSERGLALAVVTADCVPAVLCDRAGTVVGVAHGGWRGLAGGVLEALVTALPVPSGDLIAWLGPAIGPAAYEVGEDVTSAVLGLPDGERLAALCLRPGAPGKDHLDLFTLSECLLESAGVREVITDRLCTYSDRRFHSYRRDGTTNRMATLGWLI